MIASWGPWWNVVWMGALHQMLRNVLTMLVGYRFWQVDFAPRFRVSTLPSSERPQKVAGTGICFGESWGRKTSQAWLPSNERGMSKLRPSRKKRKRVLRLLPATLNNCSKPWKNMPGREWQKSRKTWHWECRNMLINGSVCFWRMALVVQALPPNWKAMRRRHWKRSSALKPWNVEAWLCSWIDLHCHLVCRWLPQLIVGRQWQSSEQTTWCGRIMVNFSLSWSYLFWKAPSNQSGFAAQTRMRNRCSSIPPRPFSRPPPHSWEVVWLGQHGLILQSPGRSWCQQFSDFTGPCLLNSMCTFTSLCRMSQSQQRRHWSPRMQLHKHASVFLDGMWCRSGSICALEHSSVFVGVGLCKWSGHQGGLLTNFSYLFFPAFN